MSALGDEEVHVWWLGGPEDASAERIERCTALLSPDEHARMGRFHFAADRLRYLFAHALVRTTLTRYAPETPPERWRFRTNEYGRPEIMPEQGGPPLRFNLSHTAGMVACAVARGRDVGVDVEHVMPPRGDVGLEIAAQFFAPAELAALAAQPREARRERFFALWTLKEAYIKARGMGLALPLDQFAFDLDRAAPPGAAAPIHLAFTPEMNDDEARWHFTRFHPTPQHALALAVRRESGETVAVRILEQRP